jgi:hypothetical protein
MTNLRSVSLIGTLSVLIHLAIVMLHGSAHTSLRVELSPWQTAFVMIVILALPPVAAILLWTRLNKAGLILLTTSMVGSLIFGVYFHYVAISPDHVSHLPPGEARGLFRSTALLLVLSEGAASLVGVWGLRRTRLQQ